MSDSNRSRYVAIGLAALGLVLIAFGLGAYTVSLAYGHGEEQCAKTANDASNAEQDCPRQVDTDRHGLPYLAESIASNPEPKDSAERERRDLAAQESMSVWAFWMMAFSAVGIVITAIGTSLLLWQIILTRKAVTDTGNATKAMEDANKIAQESIVMSSRPWVTINNIETELQENFRLDGEFVTLAQLVTFNLKNIGNSPAKVLHTKADYSFRKRGEDPPHFLPAPDTYSAEAGVGKILAPSEALAIHHYIKADMWRKIGQEDTAVCWVYISVRYRAMNSQHIFHTEQTGMFQSEIVTQGHKALQVQQRGVGGPQNTMT